MTADERVKTVIDFGFTERQVRFLVLVVRHSGVRVPREYASFAGIANGGKKSSEGHRYAVPRDLRCSPAVG